MPITLKDIAKMLGVAESTVSRAINNKPGVSKKTRKEILKIVNKYNYKPNQLAQGLAKKETHIIALLLANLENPAYTEIIKSIEDIANQAGYQIILCNTDNDIEKEKSYFELIKRNIVDGAIIVGGELTDKKILNIALNEEAPIVLVNRLSEELLIPTILIDNAHGGYLATRHLIEQKLQRIALIMGSSRDYLESEKMAGYSRALKEVGFSEVTDLIVETGGTRESGYDAFLQLMELTDPPQGFFVTSDLLAVGLVEAIKMGGYLIPRDFSIVGYGESLITSIINPTLTVVSEPLQKLGQLAATNLIKILQDNEPDEMIQVLEPVIKLRNSSIPQFKNK